MGLFKIDSVAANGNGKYNELTSQEWKSIDIKGSGVENYVLWGARGISYQENTTNEQVLALRDNVVVNKVAKENGGTGTLTVLQSEIERWYRDDATLRGKSLIDFAEFDLIITYPSKDSTDTNTYFYDTLEGCRFLNNSRDNSQGGSEPEAALELSIRSIKWNLDGGDTPEITPGE